MYLNIWTLLSILTLFTLFKETEAWSGCIHYRTVTRSYYDNEQYCCPGWTHSGNLVCTKPICSPACQNGGTCLRPFTCQCSAGFEGDICGGMAACSHLSPCYPGRCFLNSGKSECMCSDNFGGSTCLNLIGENQKPEIQMINATFAYYSYTKKEYAYDFMTDATGKTDIDFVWVNQEEFNHIKFDIDASVDTEYNFQSIQSQPDYIRGFKFGIVDANVRVQHKKLGSSGEYIAATNDYKCQEPSDETPVANRVLECRLSGTNIIQLDSGDKYTLTFTVTTGGYRDLINPDTRLFYQRQIYNGISSQNEMEYKFDYDVPVHCIEFGTCVGNDVPLKLEKDITKEHIRSVWKGWSDRNLSGIKRYALEFWKMEYSSDYDGLKEPDILPDYNPAPQYITEVNASDTIEFPIYKPSEPGVYSVILEVADRANNSRYARRLVIYDDSSEVTINKDFRLYATSASEQSDFIWQTSPNADDVQHITLSVTWKGHFINNLHENNHFLAKVLDYTPRLSDNMKRVDYKKINDGFDDNEGERNKSAIPNVKSIVKFEVAHGTESSISPSTGWNIVSPIKESDTFDLTGVDIRSGDSRQIWVKAFDVMGNTKIDSTIVYFDSSPPQIWEPTFQPNVRNGKYHFSSRITMQAKDEHSGLKKFSFKFRVKSTNEVTHEKELDISTQPPETCRNSPSTCYCIRKGECFLLNTVVDIDNCWLKVPIEKVKDEIHEVEITVYNLAVLSSATTYTIGMVDSLNGVLDYNSPTNITIVQTTDTSLSIKWVQAPTCYERAGIMIILYKPDNTTIQFKVYKDATTFDLTGLTPTTKYRFALYTKYGNDSFFVTSGSSAALNFVTAEKSRGFPPGGVAGLVVGMNFGKE